MERHDGRVSRRDDRWRWARVPAATTGLVLVERVLMDEVGSPATLLGVLGDLGHAWADPVASVLALIAFITEALVAYMLVVLLLHSLCLLPGFMGRLAGRLMALVTRWWSGACSTCSSGAHCSPSWPWRRHRVRRPAIDGLVRPWRRPRPCPSAVLSVQPP